MLSEDIRLDLNKTISITRNMLPSDVLMDLNKTVSITRDMLPVDVLADLNKSAPELGPITLSMLDAEVTAKFDSNTSGKPENTPRQFDCDSLSAGSFDRHRNWFGKNSSRVSVARSAFDGGSFGW